MPRLVAGFSRFEAARADRRSDHRTRPNTREAILAPFDAFSRQRRFAWPPPVFVLPHHVKKSVASLAAEWYN